MHRRNRIRLPSLEERVQRLVWRRQEHDATRLAHDPLESRSDGCRRCAPYQENGIDAIETAIEGFRDSEISTHHFHVRRQASRPRVADERADFHARGRQLQDDLATDPAGRSDDENAIHREPS